MATIDLGKIKLVNRGAYNNSTAYTVDDLVQSGGTTYICIQNSTGNAVTNTSYWNVLAQKGTDGTDVGTTLTTQGDILYRDGSGLQRLAAGTSGQVLQTGGSGANPSWGTVSSDFVRVNTTTMSGSTDTVSLDVFNSTYDNYFVLITGVKETTSTSTGSQLRYRLRTSGGDYTSSTYYVAGGGTYIASGGVTEHNAGQWQTNSPDLNGWGIPNNTTQSGNAERQYKWWFFNVNSSRQKNALFEYVSWERGGTYVNHSFGGVQVENTAAQTGFTFYNSAGRNLDSTMKIITYGLKS
tara:strand:- start:1506 stop:2390 length:885 start_codon:yes stop_codon:yes gene_type:complete